MREAPAPNARARFIFCKAAGVLALVLSALAAPPAQATALEDLRRQFEAPWQAKDWPAAEAVARQIVAQPQSTASDWRNLVRVLAAQGKGADAFAARQELVKRPGANSNDYTSICWYQLEHNQPLAARVACQKAVDLDATNHAALVDVGHSFLLAGDPAQAMAWYRRTLPHIQKDEEFQDAVYDFNLFIKNGWSAADAEAGKQWFEQAWPQLVALRQLRSKAAEQARQGQPLAAMTQLLAGRTQAMALLGDGAEGDRFLDVYASVANDALGDLIHQKHQHAQALAFVDRTLQSAGAVLPDATRWVMLHHLKTQLCADGQTALAQQVHERIRAELQARPGTDAAKPATAGEPGMACSVWPGMKAASMPRPPAAVSS